MFAQAPTGSGKTAVLELAIVWLLKQDIESKYKAVYMAPTKALCSERFDDWRAKFSRLGRRLTVTMVTGDSDATAAGAMQSATLIITTPEKWDSLTRDWRDSKIVQAVRLMLIDEVHTLDEGRRGATLETILTRMKVLRSSLCTSTKHRTPPFRFIAISATVPNVFDIAQWLGESSDNPAQCLTFGPEYRPVKLTTFVETYSAGTSVWAFDGWLNARVHEVISKYNRALKPTLIFCSTRKQCEQLASKLTEDGVSYVLGAEHKRKLSAAQPRIVSKSLRGLIKSGVAYHHAGLDVPDKKLVEELFLDGMLPILTCTSTLAVGVNLPAFLVIIKNTQTYRGRQMVEYKCNEVLQMCGRAGRPQFENEGKAVIMTRCEMAPRYRELTDGQQTIESALADDLTEHVNSEVVLKTITDLNSALEWIKQTFLYVRVTQKPEKYFNGQLSSSATDAELEEALQQMVLAAIGNLTQINAITMDANDMTVSTTFVGREMAKLSVSFRTTELFVAKLRGPPMDPYNVLLVLAQAGEYADITLRNTDKKLLRQLNSRKRKSDKNEIVRFPVPGTGAVKTKEEKIVVLIQSDFADLFVNFDTAQFSADLNKIFKDGRRIVPLLVSLLDGLHGPDLTLPYNTIASVMKVAASMAGRVWWDSSSISRQIPGIGPVKAAQLVTAGLTSLETLSDATSAKLEDILNTRPPSGTKMKASINTWPKMQLKLDIEEPETLTISIQCTNPTTAAPQKYSEKWILVVAINDQVQLFRAWPSRKILHGGITSLSLPIPGSGGKLESYLGCSSLAGVNTLRAMQLPMRDTIPPATDSIGLKQLLADSDTDTDMEFSTSDIQAMEALEAAHASLKPGYRPCGHKCNKLTCLHDCCKYGVPQTKAQKPKATRKQTANEATQCKTKPQSKQGNVSASEGLRSVVSNETTAALKPVRLSKKPVRLSNVGRSNQKQTNTRPLDQFMFKQRTSAANEDVIELTCQETQNVRLPTTSEHQGKNGNPILHPHDLPGSNTVKIWGQDDDQRRFSAFEYRKHTKPLLSIPADSDPVPDTTGPNTVSPLRNDRLVYCRPGTSTPLFQGESEFVDNRSDSSSGDEMLVSYWGDTTQAGSTHSHSLTASSTTFAHDRPSSPPRNVSVASMHTFHGPFSAQPTPFREPSFIQSTFSGPSSNDHHARFQPDPAPIFTTDTYSTAAQPSTQQDLKPGDKGAAYTDIFSDLF